MALLNQVLNLPIKQLDVDFVIPDVHVDRRLGIDPFLLYRSLDPLFQNAHQQLINFFSFIIHTLRDGNIDLAQQLLLFPEPNEIGLGYTEKGIAGSGVGPDLAREITEILHSSSALLNRGFRHIEELQLICVGVGPDRISDISANILKLFLVDYTQKNCEAWNIPVQRAVPIHHYWDVDSAKWRDGYFDLPINPITGQPLLLVPRRVLRILPWINYDEYVGEYSRHFLKAPSKRRDPKLTLKYSARRATEKQVVCQVTRQNTMAMDSYVEKKEMEAIKAQADELSVVRELSLVREHGEKLLAQLRATAPGREDAYEYQDIVHKIITYCLHPHLADGRPQERTYEGTLIRDLIFVNEGTRNFWRYLQQQYGNLLFVFELKNKNEVNGSDVDQLATYLGDPLGRCGVLLTRTGSHKSFKRRKVIYNKDVPRKAILHMTDNDLNNLIQLRADGKECTPYIQNLYRQFLVSIE